MPSAIKWTPAQVKYLKDNYKAKSIRILTTELDIARTTIRVKMKKLGLVRTDMDRRALHLIGTRAADHSRKARRGEKMFPGSTIYAIAGMSLARKEEMKTQKPTAMQIIDDIADVNDTTVQILRGQKRSGHLVFCRQIFCWFAKKLLALSDADIGNYINRDRTTVIYYHQITRDLLKQKDPWFVDMWAHYLDNTKYLKIKQNG